MKNIFVLIVSAIFLATYGFVLYDLNASVLAPDMIQYNFCNMKAWNSTYSLFLDTNKKAPEDFSKLIVFLKTIKNRLYEESAMPEDRISSIENKKTAIKINYKSFPWSFGRQWCILSLVKPTQKINFDQILPNQDISADQKNSGYYVNSYCSYSIDNLDLRLYEQGYGLTRQEAEVLFPEIKNQ